MLTSRWFGWPVAAAMGPFAAFRTRWGLAILGVLAAILLTLTTQIGGLILWFCWPLLTWTNRRLGHRPAPLAMAASVMILLLIYGVLSFAVLPPLASAFGRERLPCFSTDDRPLRAVSAFFCVTNRNYARPEIVRMLDDLATGMWRGTPGIETAYLDAGFPFFDGFPMLPHLSHRHGRDIDLAFFYRPAGVPDSVPTAGSWPLGYWLYVQPRPGDPQPCAVGTLDLRWDWDWLQPVGDPVVLAERHTASMLNWLSVNGGRYGVRKILLEPHLQRRLATDPNVVRFQGCRAARHDDHLHLQLR